MAPAGAHLRLRCLAGSNPAPSPPAPGAHLALLLCGQHDSEVLVGLGGLVQLLHELVADAVLGGHDHQARQGALQARGAGGRPRPRRSVWHSGSARLQPRKTRRGACVRHMGSRPTWPASCVALSLAGRRPDAVKHAQRACCTVLGQHQPRSAGCSAQASCAHLVRLLQRLHLGGHAKADDQGQALGGGPRLEQVGLELALVPLGQRRGRRRGQEGSGRRTRLGAPPAPRCTPTGRRIPARGESPQGSSLASLPLWLAGLATLLAPHIRWVRCADSAAGGWGAVSWPAWQRSPRHLALPLLVQDDKGGGAVAALALLDQRVVGHVAKVQVCGTAGVQCMGRRRAPGLAAGTAMSRRGGRPGWPQPRPQLAAPLGWKMLCGRQGCPLNTPGPPPANTPSCTQTRPLTARAVLHAGAYAHSQTGVAPHHCAAPRPPLQRC